MPRKAISVRIIGDPSGIADAMDDARLLCVRRALDGYTAEEQEQILAMVHARYAPR